MDIKTRRFTVDGRILDQLPGRYQLIGPNRFRSTTGTIIRIVPFLAGGKNGPVYQLLHVGLDGSEVRVSGVFTDPLRFDAVSTSGRKFRYRIIRTVDDQLNIEVVQ